MRVSLLAAALAALSGCATIPQPTRIERVEVPVSVPCVGAVPQRPELLAERVWADEVNEYLRVRALLVDRGRLLRHVDRLEALLSVCVSGDLK